MTSNEGAIVIIDTKYIYDCSIVYFIVWYLCQNANMADYYSTYAIKINCTVLMVL